MRRCNARQSGYGPYCAVETGAVPVNTRNRFIVTAARLIPELLSDFVSEPVNSLGLWPQSWSSAWMLLDSCLIIVTDGHQMTSGHYVGDSREDGNVVCNCGAGVGDGSSRGLGGYGEAALPLPLPPSLVRIPFMTVTSATAHVPIGGILTPSAERYGHWRRRRDCEGSADRHRPRCRGVVYRSTHLLVLRPTSLTVL